MIEKATKENLLALPIMLGGVAFILGMFFTGRGIFLLDPRDYSIGLTTLAMGAVLLLIPSMWRLREPCIKPEVEK